MGVPVGNVPKDIVADQSLEAGSYLVQNNSPQIVKITMRDAALPDPEDVKTDGNASDHTLWPAGSGSIEAMIANVEDGNAIYVWVPRTNAVASVGVTPTGS